MKKIEKFETIRPLIDEAFKKGESFTFKPNGNSMHPFIKGGKTLVTIEKYKDCVRKFDIVFYTRDNSKYVLHRVVKINNGKLFACGDNLWWLEEIDESKIFARLSLVNGKETKGSFLYLHTLFLRRFFIHIKDYIKRHFGGKKK